MTCSDISALTTYYDFFVSARGNSRRPWILRLLRRRLRYMYRTLTVDTNRIVPQANPPQCLIQKHEGLYRSLIQEGNLLPLHYLHRHRWQTSLRAVIPGIFGEINLAVGLLELAEGQSVRNRVSQGDGIRKERMMEVRSDWITRGVVARSR